MSAIDEQLASITASVGVLASSVQELTNRQAKQVDGAKKIALVALAGFMLDMILTVVGVFLVAKANDNSDRISDQQNRLSSIQSIITKDGICPLYSIQLSNYNPQSPGAVAFPARYEATYKSYEAGATKLNCAHHIRGPFKP